MFIVTFALHNAELSCERERAVAVFSNILTSHEEGLSCGFEFKYKQ